MTHWQILGVLSITIGIINLYTNGNPLFWLSIISGIILLIGKSND